jgi:hypothetical protein
MLRELYELSTFVDKALPPVGYGYLIAHIEVDIAPPLTITAATEPDDKGKEQLGKEYVLPDFVRSSGDRPLPVADTASYVLGVGKGGSARKMMYRKLLEECYAETEDDLIELLCQSVEAISVEKIRVACTPWLDVKAKTGEDPLEKSRIVFLFNGELITSRESVKKFWAKQYTQLRASSSLGECCITGLQRILVDSTLPVMIKGVRGSQGKGAALMSFNYESIESRRWKDSDHAPLGFDVAERSHQMLNKLLQEKRHSYSQGKNAFVYWGEYDVGLNPEIWESPEELWEDDGATVAQMIFMSPDTPQGFSAEDCKAVHFYLAILTGCDGRVAISRWDETTPAQIAQNVTRYISSQKSFPGYKARPIWQLAGSCFRDASKEQIEPVVQALIMNALWGSPIPRGVIVKVLERAHLDLFSSQKDIKYYSRYYSRFQILALYRDTMTAKQTSTMARKLQIAQILGAIAYLMNDAEMTARNVDDPGKTGVAGSLRALASTPKNVFGRLYQNAILYHLPTPCNDGNPEKQESRRRRLKRIGKLLREEFNKFVELGLSPETDLPTTFNLDESAWFYLGWGMREATFWDGVENADSDQDQSEKKAKSNK